jgi:hypothetical protein
VYEFDTGLWSVPSPIGRILVHPGPIRGPSVAYPGMLQLGRRIEVGNFPLVCQCGPDPPILALFLLAKRPFQFSFEPGVLVESTMKSGLLGALVLERSFQFSP